MRGTASISNIAWPIEADGEALDLIADLGFAGVELAPRKVFGPLEAVSRQTLRNYKNELDARELAVTAFQAILFGVEGAHLFRDGPSRKRMRESLIRVAELAAELEVGACVFGSPGLRDPGDLAPEEAFRSAQDFFADLAPHFASAGSRLAFEANPSLYGCRFVTRTRDALRLVREVGAEGFALQIDTGTIIENNEDLEDLMEALPYAAHFHISEPGLVLPNTASPKHAAIAAAVEDCGYAGWYSIEMKERADWAEAVEASVSVLHLYPAKLVAVPSDPSGH